MSKKSELIKVLTDYKTKYEGLQAQMLEIDKSTTYTPTGREEAKEELLSGFQPVLEKYHNEGIAILDSAMESLAEKWRSSTVGKLADVGYQTGLANVIKMLEVGSIKTQDDVQNIIDAYADDYNARAMIRKVLLDNNNPFVHLVPVDNREENKKLLGDLRNNIDHCISVESLRTTSRSWNVFNHSRTHISVRMSSMAEFVAERFNDDLELLAQS